MKFKHEITAREWIVGSAIVLIMCWAQFLFPRFESGISFMTVGTIPHEWGKYFAIYPRNIESLPGIVTMHFIHGSLSHLAGNLGMLIVFMIILAKNSMRFCKVLGSIAITSGTMVWMFHPASSEYVNIVGASAVVFGLVGYILPRLIFNKEFWDSIKMRKGKDFLKLVALNVYITIVGATVLIAYWELISGGIGLGTSEARVSLAAHLYGVIAGVLTYFAELIYIVKSKNSKKEDAETIEKSVVDEDPFGLENRQVFTGNQ